MNTLLEKLEEQEQYNDDNDFKRKMIESISNDVIEIRGALTNFVAFIGFIEVHTEHFYKVTGAFNQKQKVSCDVYIKINQVAAVGDDYIVMKMDYLFYTDSE